MSAAGRVALDLLRSATGGTYAGHMAYNDMIAAELRAEISRQNMSREAVWTQVAQTNPAKVSRSTWHRMIRGDESTPFDLNTLDATVQALGITISTLLDGAGSGRSAQYRCILPSEDVSLNMQVRGLTAGRLVAA